MNTNILFRFVRRNSRLLGFGALCVMASFGLGIQTAGDVQPVAQSLAQEERIDEGLIETGDLDGDSVLTVSDAIAILEVVAGYREPTKEELASDPNRDFRLTVDDALRVLRTLSLR